MYNKTKLKLLNDDNTFISFIKTAFHEIYSLKINNNKIKINNLNLEYKFILKYININGGLILRYIINRMVDDKYKLFNIIIKCPYLDINTIHRDGTSAISKICYDMIENDFLLYKNEKFELQSNIRNYEVMYKILKKLLKRIDVDINKPDNRGLNPLLNFIYFGNDMKIFKIFLNRMDLNINFNNGVYLKQLIKDYNNKGFNKKAKIYLKLFFNKKMNYNYDKIIIPNECLEKMKTDKWLNKLIVKCHLIHNNHE